MSFPTAAAEKRRPTAYAQDLVTLPRPRAVVGLCSAPWARRQRSGSRGLLGYGSLPPFGDRRATIRGGRHLRLPGGDERDQHVRRRPVFLDLDHPRQPGQQHAEALAAVIALI